MPTYGILNGLRVVEMASFIAAPSCGLHLLQLGAEVIRVDPLSGGADSRRWPRSPEGHSFYWEGLNKGKKSVAIDLGRPQGRELAAALIAAPGENAGIFVTNLPPHGFFSHDNLAARRSDLISVRVMGWGDGRTAMDPAVNAAFGLPYMTGPAAMAADDAVNHSLPAWDLVTGTYAAFTVLAAERERRLTGTGRDVRVPLSDIAAVSMAHIGHIAEVTAGADRPRYGNDLFGAFGRDFVTSDGRRVMIVAITPRQWSSLVAALGLGEAVASVEQAQGVSFAVDEGVRFEHRDRLFPYFETAVGALSEEELGRRLDSAGVCWSRYRTTREALAEEATFGPDYGLFETVSHPSGHAYATPGAPARFIGSEARSPASAPVLGQHTDEVLSISLGLTQSQIGALHDEGVIAGAKDGK